jgi:hypothetical protein
VGFHILVIDRSEVANHQLIEARYLVKVGLQFLLLVASVLDAEEPTDIVLPHVVESLLELFVGLDGGVLFAVAPGSLGEGGAVVAAGVGSEVEEGKATVEAVAIAPDCTVAGE